MHDWISWVMAVVTFIFGVGNIVLIFMQIPHIRKFGNRAGNVNALMMCTVAAVISFAATAFSVWRVINAH